MIRTLARAVGGLLAVVSQLACDPPPRPSSASPDAGNGSPGAGLSPGLCLDNDGDGVPGTGDCDPDLLFDCEEENPAVFPGAEELCDGKDQDCDGEVDEDVPELEYFTDRDGDGYGSGTPELSCDPILGKAPRRGDCDDGDPKVSPGAPETCNRRDDDCNGKVDDGFANGRWFPDLDHDGYGAAQAAVELSCTPVAGKVSNDGDCNDAVHAVRPNARESCNNLDDDCDGTVDDGNPGGGTLCNSGQPGVCAAGTVQCQGGALTCLRNVGPSTERCDGLDNDCDNQVDETWPTKGQSCTAGLGVCARSGTVVCKADSSGTACSAAAGVATANACDGLDNDCDGVADEPVLTATDSFGATAWQQVEVAPYYYSATGCAGGAGSGSDPLVGGGAVLAGGSGGLSFHRLDSEGRPTGATSPMATQRGYQEVAIAQSGDGFVIAGVYLRNGVPRELDFFYVDGATGASRASLSGQFPSLNTIDSLRLVRGNGRRVTALWRESGVGVKLARLETAPVGTGFVLQRPGGGALSAVTLVASAQVQKGLGADVAMADWLTAHFCSPPTLLRSVGVAYLAGPQALRFFTVNEDGSAKSADVVVDNKLGSTTIVEPEVAYFYSGGERFLVAYVQATSFTNDLQYWLTNAQSVHSAYASLASLNGASSIRRPRAGADGTHVWLTALRYVSEPTAFKRQLMFRRIDYAGNKDPSSPAVEVSPTSGGCAQQQLACRPGDKDAVAVWASRRRIYYSASGSTLSGSYASALTCE